MLNILTEKSEKYEWIDIEAPNEDDLMQVAAKYDLHESSLKDCLQPGHLPKYEKMRHYTFIILRVYFPDIDVTADSVQQITSKIAIFISDSFILTIHRKEWKIIEDIGADSVRTGDCKTTWHVLQEIVKAGLLTFDEPGAKITQSLEYFERQVFLTERKAPLLKGLYYNKRKLDVIRRLLLLTYDVVDKIDPPATTNAYTRDIRDLYIKQKSLYDSLTENTNHLLNIYFNISSQRTNETIRILTIFSVFFMPLTFIVGVYGMNFDNMPELRMKWGYPSVLILMTGVILGIYTWFKRKKWL